ncbi:MAG: sensor signal transduction histidine kinase [Flaviaesturariibacter sp.]|nr:sensor signal transduction histidine kinase [Flaviaesturariibacter sp.]
MTKNLQSPICNHRFPSYFHPPNPLPVNPEVQHEISVPPFLQGGGEMGERTRLHDWSQTPLGPIDTWPQSLRSTLGILLHSAFPMFLFWGDDHICFYNDAYRPSLGNDGKHPAVGKKGTEVWPDIWDFIGPLIHAVRTTAEPVWFEDQLLPIHRNGRMENVNWTFSYSPAYGDDGSVSGVFVTCMETTKAMEDKKRLAESESLFRSMVEQAPVAIALTRGEDMVIESINESMLRIMEKTDRSEALHRSLPDVLPQLRDQEILEVIRAVYRNGQAFSGADMPVTMITDGKPDLRFYDISYTPVVENGQITSVLHVAVDVTDKVRSRKAMEESEYLFRNLLQETPVATALYRGGELRIQYVNDLMIKYWGKDASVIGKTMREALPELHNQHFPESMDRVFASGEPYVGFREKADLVVDGKLQSFYFNFTFKPLRSVDGSIYGVHHTAIDVTSEVLAQQKLEESEKNLRNTVLQAPVAMCILKGPDNIVEIANERIIELWGATGRNVIGRSIFEGVPEVSGQGFEELLHHVYTTGETYKASGVPLNVMRNGRIDTIYVDFVYEAYREDDRSIGGVIAAAIDVTEQMTAQMKLSLAEEKVRMAVASAALGTYEIDLATNEVISSERFNELWGTTRTLTRDEFVSAIHPDDLPGRDKANEQALETGGLTYEARVRRPDGTQIWVRITGRFAYDKNGEPNLLIGVVQDITEQKLFAEELRKQVQERTAELERKNIELQRSNGQLEEFAHAASHDLKEPIRKIHFFTDMLKKQLGAKLVPDDERIFDRVEHATKRMNALIDDLLLYSHVSQKPHEKESINLNEKIAKVQEDLELDIAEKQAVIVVGPLPVVKGYRRQIQQLFHNLFTNALKYSLPERPPRISVEAATVTGEEAGLDAGRAYHRITVSDNGIGFEQEHADRIFQMFQRLHGKNEYKGTGVGLSIVRKVAENHGGKITAEGIPGEGATFHLYLPVED